MFGLGGGFRSQIREKVKTHTQGGGVPRRKKKEKKHQGGLKKRKETLGGLPG